jgi:NAD(P)-dependent dehydrogenase (short-subunit alcohol dehydrogenase family)
VGDHAPVPPDLAGRVAVVTGAARGMGRAIVARLVAADATVLALDRDAAALEAIAGPANLHPVLADMASGAPADLADHLVARHGPVELIVNHVGANTRHTFLELEPDDFDLVFRTNLRGPWFFTRQLVRNLVAAGRPGSIVFTSSVHDTHLSGTPHYSASKAAVVMLARELAFELGRHRIRVNVVSPGDMDTPGNPGRPDRTDRARRLVPLGRRGRPDDVAGLVVMLLSDAWCGYVTGASVVVDGGLSLHSWSMDP